MYIVYKNKWRIKNIMNNLSSFYKNRFDSFLVHLAKAKELNEGDVHKLRVDIKNMRSLLLLVDTLCIEEKVIGKLLKQLRPVFKYSGRLRTIQVCASLVNNHDVKRKGKVVKLLEKNKKDHSKALLHSLEKFDVAKFQIRTSKLDLALQKVEIEELVQKADKIILDELDLIYKLWASSRNEEHYHDIRKFFKIIKTLLQLLIHLKSNDNLIRESKIVNETESILGDWHDRDVLDKKLAVIQSSATTPDFKSLVREIKNKNRSEKNVLVKDFKKQMLGHFLKH